MPMTPLQSWATMLLLIIFAIALTYLLMRLDARVSRKLSEHRLRRAEAIERSMAHHPAGRQQAPSATVTPLHQAPSLREQPGRRAHLRLVEDTPVAKRPAPRLYDHEIDGL